MKYKSDVKKYWKSEKRNTSSRVLNIKQNSRSERADLGDMSPDFNLHKRRLEAFEHTHTCMILRRK